MCVPQNASLSWIPRIVAQLAAPELRTLTISLAVNNVIDLRLLNSECAVPELTLAHFDDMRVLDWPSLEQTLTSEDLGGLEKVVLEGQGPYNELEAYIEQNCPELHARRIMSFAVGGSEAPAWSSYSDI